MPGGEWDNLQGCAGKTHPVLTYTHSPEHSLAFKKLFSNVIFIKINMFFLEGNNTQGLIYICGLLPHSIPASQRQALSMILAIAASVYLYISHE